MAKLKFTFARYSSRSSDLFQSSSQLVVYLDIASFIDYYFLFLNFNFVSLHIGQMGPKITNFAIKTSMSKIRYIKCTKFPLVYFVRVFIVKWARKEIFSKICLWDPCLQYGARTVKKIKNRNIIVYIYNLQL